MVNNTTSTFSPEKVIVPIVFSIIFFTGLVGNGLLLFFVARYKILQTIPNVFITNLAVGDILLLLVCVPFTSTVYTFDEWPYGELVCKMNEFLKTVSIGVSIFTLTALSIERYAAITMLHRGYHVDGTRRRVAMTIFGIWVTAVALALPDMMSSHTRTHPHSNIVFCHPHHPSFGDTYPQIHTVIRFVALFAAPVIVITTFYSLLATHLIKSRPDAMVNNRNGEKANCNLANNESNNQTTKNGDDAITRRKNVAKVVLCLSATFVMCWLPYHVYTLWFFFDPGRYNMFWHVFKITGFCLAFLNSCVNPFVMYYLDQRFRNSFNKLFFCGYCRGRENEQADEISLDNLNEDQSDFPCLIETTLQTQVNKPTYL